MAGSGQSMAFGPEMCWQMNPVMGYPAPMVGQSIMMPQNPIAYQQKMPPPLATNQPYDVYAAGCGGSILPCAPQGEDVAKQARERKPRPPSSHVPKRKIGINATSCTTVATPFASVPDLREDQQKEDKDSIPDHERFDTFTLAFGTKPGSDKPAKMLITLKSPKVLAARMTTNCVGTQVGYWDLGLPDPNSHEPVSQGRKSKQSTRKGSSKSRKRSKGGKKSKSKK